MSAYSRKKRAGKLPKAKPKPSPRSERMRHPVRCPHCRHVHDGAEVLIVDRLKDCSTWRCSNCLVLIDDRPERFGGAPRVQPKATPTPRRTPRSLPWEGADAPDRYDRGIARMMQEVPGR